MTTFKKKIWAKCANFEVSNLELQISSLGVFDEVSVSSRNFNQVLVSEVTVSTTSLTVSLKKRGTRQLPRYPSLIFLPELAISLVDKAHVTKMKLNFNIFPLVLQIPQTSYCIFEKPVICTNLITCSTKLSLHAAERGQYVL